MLCTLLRRGGGGGDDGAGHGGGGGGDDDGEGDHDGHHDHDNVLLCRCTTRCSASCFVSTMATMHMCLTLQTANSSSDSHMSSLPSPLRTLIQQVGTRRSASRTRAHARERE
eukprot:6211935-Pleurochrysis_carterae.AAC.2